MQGGQEPALRWKLQMDRLHPTGFAEITPYISNHALAQ